MIFFYNFSAFSTIFILSIYPILMILAAFSKILFNKCVLKELKIIVCSTCLT